MLPSFELGSPSVLILKTDNNINTYERTTSSRLMYLEKKKLNPRLLAVSQDSCAGEHVT